MLRLSCYLTAALCVCTGNMLEMSNLLNFENHSQLISGCLLVSAFVQPTVERFDNVLLVKQNLSHGADGRPRISGLTRQQLLAHADFIEELTKTKLEIFGQ